MSVGSGRTAARQRALASQKAWREAEAERTKRRQAWAVDVAVALGERDETIARCERAAGAALAKLVEDGLSLEDAIVWAGGVLTVKDARALIAAASEQVDQNGGRGGEDAPASPSPREGR